MALSINIFSFGLKLEHQLFLFYNNQFGVDPSVKKWMEEEQLFSQTK